MMVGVRDVNIGGGGVSRWSLNISPDEPHCIKWGRKGGKL